MTNDEKFEARLSSFEEKLEILEVTINSLVEQVSKGFSTTNTKIDKLREDSNLGFQKVDDTMEDVIESINKLRHVTRFEEEYNDMTKFPQPKGNA